MGPPRGRRPHPSAAGTDPRTGPALEDDTPPPPRVRVDVDLNVPGALGPETHVYGSMAIHLYMRDPNAANGTDAAG